MLFTTITISSSRLRVVAGARRRALITSLDSMEDGAGGTGTLPCRRVNVRPACQSLETLVAPVRWKQGCMKCRHLVPPACQSYLALAPHFKSAVLSSNAITTTSVADSNTLSIRRRKHETLSASATATAKGHDTTVCCRVIPARVVSLCCLLGREQSMHPRCERCSDCNPSDFARRRETCTSDLAVVTYAACRCVCLCFLIDFVSQRLMLDARLTSGSSLSQAKRQSVKLAGYAGAR